MKRLYVLLWVVCIHIALNLFIFVDLLGQAGSADDGANLDKANYYDDDTDSQRGILNFLVHGYSTALEAW